MNLSTAFVLSAAMVLAQAKGPDAAQPDAAASAEAIAKAIRNLSADDFTERERASEFLWRAGPAAIPALEKAAAGDDFETKFRAQSILDKVRYGITPETPAEVAKLLETFRKGDLNVKVNIVRSLKDKGETKIILQLMRVEKDPTFQRVAGDLYRAELDRMLPQLLAKRDYDAVEQVLTQNAVQDATMQRLAAFWVVRGKGEDQAVKMREGLEKREDPVVRRQLIWLLRAKGDLPAAVLAAEKLTDKELALSLATETRDWKTAAKIEQEMVGPFDPPLPELARIIAWQRLAGNQAEVDKAAAAIRTRGEGSLSDVWLAAKGLLLNERASDGIDLLRKDLPDVAFRLLAYRSDFDGALKLAGAEPGTVFDRDWYNKLPSQERTAINVHRFTYAADIMRQLYWLGRKEDAAKLRKLLLEITDEVDNRNLNGRVTLASMELRAGMDDEALEDAADALHQPGGRAILARYFPKHYGYAILWWDHLRKNNPAQKSRETLLTLQQLLRTSARQPPLKGWEEIVAKASEEAGALDPPHRGQWLQMLAETCDLQGNRMLALKYAKDAVDELPVAGLTYGRLLEDDQQHDAAAAAYLKVWENDVSQVVALHLCGKSLIAAGKAEVGMQKVETAGLLCLDAAARRNLAFNLHERGFSADALPHYELAVRTGPAESWHISNAAENVGNLIVKTEPLRAADLWERLQLYLLSPTANPTEFEPLLDIGRLVHKTRARGLLEAGKKDEALAEMKLCEQIAPGNIDLAEDMVPLLKAKGFAAEADDLYERAYAIHAPLAQKFPESPSLRNNVAWLSAISHQRLDEALVHAQKAVELSPSGPNYLDTLAEVYFQKGERPKAVEYAKKVLELAPSNKLFAERLKHFENDPLPK
jgi:tetratricopeptide (TPR) repeat protein